MSNALIKVLGKPHRRQARPRGKVTRRDCLRYLTRDEVLQTVRSALKRVPDMPVHAFSPMEIMNGVSKANLSFRDWLQQGRTPAWTPSPAPRPRSSTTRSAGS
ncbi:hypothetical protein [Actinophytocola sp.]|uniref:hypothetical protein n=1 Tax=Actinophytocola sp. TaxID=1872138 RepID=UPI003D6B6D15